jgi:hypothetical protein
MVGEAGDDARAAGRAPLMQVIDAGNADVGSGGGVDAGGRGLHQRQSHRVAPQQHQAHFGLVYLDLEPEHLTQERGGGRKIVNFQIGSAAQELGHRHMLWPPGSPTSADRRRYARRPTGKNDCRAALNGRSVRQYADIHRRTHVQQQRWVHMMAASCTKAMAAEGGCGLSPDRSPGSWAPNLSPSTSSLSIMATTGVRQSRRAAPSRTGSPGVILRGWKLIIGPGCHESPGQCEHCRPRSRSWTRPARGNTVRTSAAA